MSIWQTLGITQTNDEKEIRRAYARQVKNIDPIATLKSINNYVKLLRRQKICRLRYL